MDEDRNPETSNGASRRKVLSASTAAGVALFGYGGVVGTASADDDGLERGSHPTPAEFERSLAESEHIGFKPGVRKQVDKDAIDSVRQLDTSVTAGEGHPDVYYGKFQNTEAPSGEYYRVSDGDSGLRDNDRPISMPDRGVWADSHQKYEIDIGFDLGCFSPSTPWYLPGLPEACVSASAGFRIGLLNDDPANVTIGGEVFLEFDVSVAGYGVTVSPGSYGITVGKDASQGICVDTKFSAPGPLPGKIEIEPCIDVGVVSDPWDPSKVALAINGGSFTGCIQGYCQTINVSGVDVQTPYIDLGDIPSLDQEMVSPGLPSGRGI
jgi:hypothetical protein